MHGSGRLAVADGGGGCDDFGRCADDLAGNQSRIRGKSRQIRSVETIALDVRRFVAAPFVDPLVLGHARRRDDSGLGYDGDEPARDAVAACDEALAAEADRRPALRRTSRKPGS